MNVAVKLYEQLHSTVLRRIGSNKCFAFFVNLEDSNCSFDSATFISVAGESTVLDEEACR